MPARNFNLLIFLSCLALIIFLLGFIFYPPLVSVFDDFSTQWFYGLNPRESLFKDIVIVEINDQTLKELNQKWPLDRSSYAQAINILGKDKAKVIGIDIMFQGKSLSEADDAALFESLRDFKGEVVLASSLRPDLILSPREIFSQYSRVGFINAPSDPDGVVRKLRGYNAIDDFSGFSLAVEMASSYQGVFPEKKGDFIVLGDKKMPLEIGGDFYINYLFKPEDFQVLPFHDLLSGNFPAGLFKDKITLIGPTSEAAHDIIETPFGRMAGVFAQANGLTTILGQKHLSSLPWFVSLLCLIVILAAIFLALISFSPLRGFIMSLGVIFLFLWIDIILRFGGYKLYYGPIAVSAFSFFIMGNIYNYFRFLAILLKIKNKIVLDPLTHLFTLRYFYERADLELKILPKTGRYLLVILLEGFELSVKKLNFEELRYIWKQMNSSFFSLGPLWAKYVKDIIVGIKKGKPCLEKLINDCKAVLLEKDIKLNIKAAYAEVNSAVNIPEALVYLVEGIQNSESQTVVFKAEELPRQTARMPAEEDFISGLDSEAEEKNRQLLSALEKLTAEGKKTSEAYLQLIASLVNALDAKDSYTEGHSQRVSKYAVLLTEGLGLSWEEREKIKKAAFLHDIGKIGIPDQILHKKGKLSDEEFSRIKEHEALSIKILEPIKDFKDILPYILHHHESYDGSGYPHGLAGDFIPLGARILAVADIFDALSTGRDYKDAFSLSETKKELRQLKGHKLDPELVEKFLEILRERPGDIFKE